MKRRHFLLAFLAASLPAIRSAHAAEQTITVYESPT